MKLIFDKQLVIGEVEHELRRRHATIITRSARGNTYALDGGARATVVSVRPGVVRLRIEAPPGCNCAK